MKMQHFFRVILLGSFIVDTARGMEEVFPPKDKEEADDIRFHRNVPIDESSDRLQEDAQYILKQFSDSDSCSSDTESPESNNSSSSSSIPANDNNALPQAPEANTEPAIPIEHQQAHTFHQRLIEKHPEWFKGDVQAYYKKIEPIESAPELAGEGGWNANSISIDGNNQLIPNENAEYAHNGISFNLKSFENKNFEEAFTVPVTYDNKSFPVVFKPMPRKKVPVTTRLDDYNTCIADAQARRFSLASVITLVGTLEVSGEPPRVIIIEGESNQREPIRLQGMEFVFNKRDRRTQIFFDFVGAVNGGVGTANEEIELIAPITRNHATHTADNTVFRIKEHKVYTCAGKTIYGFFDSAETRSKWVPDESGFYNLANKPLVYLPSCYCTDDRDEREQDPAGWVLGDGHTSFYQKERLEIQDANDYVHCHNNVFYALLRQRAICKEYLSQNPNNRVNFNYLEQVKKPSLRLRQNVGITGSHTPSATGLYKRVREGSNITLRPVYTSGGKCINLGNNENFDIVWPSEPLNEQETKKWSDAIQRFCNNLYVLIQRCDREITNRLSTWNTLNSLDLSRVQLEPNTNWQELLAAIGTMQQLTQFSCAHNHPASDILDERDLPAATNFHRNLATCLERLPNLRVLRLQGLWLKNHAQLGFGCINPWLISREIASLTYYIQQRELPIQAIIANISKLAHLESLSIDGIPNHASSMWARQPLILKIIAAPEWLMVSPLNFLDGLSQSDTLKRLVIHIADRLAQMPSLRTASVYSPGGNCVDYCSQAFRERLATTRAAHPNLQQLTINAEVLQ